jgi:hypothetical protein
MKTCSRAPLLGCAVGSSAAIALLSTRLYAGLATRGVDITQRRRLSARPRASRHHRKIYRGWSRCREENGPTSGNGEVCATQASHDAGKHLQGPDVGQRDTPISRIVAAEAFVTVVQCVRERRVSVAWEDAEYSCSRCTCRNCQ